MNDCFKYYVKNLNLKILTFLLVVGCNVDNETYGE